ncbi:ferric reductase like protein [Litoreibacter ponti]|uniref:Ferric reductase like protein n=1 Tax=Litoreibacter ponti TaxID=1510457 RepID=A0A2T6BPK9_9RHOB|nr:ferric reductase-like transmembrane domain-containing protein [Litoreibacter ponti]PTX58005.1 ferric reductase like protein [Litoreibacter ponti]
MSRPPALTAWLALCFVLAGPVVIAALNPLLAYRGPEYIIGGFAGILALSLLTFQPLLAAGYLPGLATPKGRRWHKWTGIALIALVVLHVVGLYLTSAPDTLDALLLVSPTPFSIYGVSAMWAVFATAILVRLRRRLRPSVWRWVHNGLSAFIVVATVIHAVQIEGAMGQTSKYLACAAALLATATALIHLRVIAPLRR